jgi:hypothetical protein
MEGNVTPTVPPAEEQDAVEKLTGAVPGIGAGTTDGGGDLTALPEGSVTLSAPNFLSKAARKDLYRVMAALGFVNMILGVSIILIAHSDPTSNWVWPAQVVLLVGFAAWFLAYLTVAGFGNVQVSIGSGGGGAARVADGDGGPTTDPVDGSADVPRDKSVTATYSTALNPDTLTKDTFTLVDDKSTAVEAAVSYDIVTKVATLKPAKDLRAKAKYTATLTDAVKDKDDKAQKALSWTFTTK